MTLSDVLYIGGAGVTLWILLIYAYYKLDQWTAEDKKIADDYAAKYYAESIPQEKLDALNHERWQG